MRYFTTIMAAAALAALTFGGCKTTEANYRAAYERARSGDSSDPIDNTIYAAIRNEALPSAAITAGGDTLRFKYERIRVTEGQGEPSDMKLYNLVAGQFKQSFNARAMASRLREGGYPATFIAQTAEPLYYVVVFSSTDAAAVAEAMQSLKSDSSVRMIDPAPFVVAATR